MTKHTHTPGPWQFIDATKVAGMRYAPKCVIKGGSKQIASFSWHECSPWYPTKDESQANASLIAAAPELLEALTALLEVHENGCNGPEAAMTVRDARAAIGKARGEV